MVAYVASRRESLYVVPGRFIIFASLGQRGWARGVCRIRQRHVEPRLASAVRYPFIPINRGIDLRAKQVIHNHAYRHRTEKCCEQFLRSVLFACLRKNAS